MAGLSKGLTLKDIALKHDPKGYYSIEDSVASLKKELYKGIKVEKEHTTDVKVAASIAMDHLVEDPKYYTKLATLNLEESKSTPNNLLLSVVKEVCNDLQIPYPKIKIINNRRYTEKNKSYAGYLPNEKSIIIVVYERTLGDICRSMIHEIYHHYQNINGELTTESGKDGDMYENEANAYAGKKMREMGRKYPDIFFMKYKNNG